MKLQEWAEKYDATIQEFNGCKCVSYPRNYELWHLEDYRVSSVVAGTIWLVEKGTLTHDQHTNRMNIRNFMLTHSLQELQQELKIFQEKLDNWGITCILELIDENMNEAKHIPLEEIVGKTVLAVQHTQVDGAYGQEPCIMLHFNDNTKHGFVLPNDE